MTTTVTNKQKAVSSKTIRSLIPRVVLLLCLLSSGFLIIAPADAQHVGKLHRIGYLSNRPASQEKILLPAFLQGLRELGYTEGKNIIIERRHEPGARAERLREMAAELVAFKVDIIVASSGTAAAKEVTTTIPIVFAVSADPVGIGLVESLARPGGNVTGLSDFHGQLVPKRLELLKEVAPSASRIAFLWNADSNTGPLQLKQLQAVVPGLGVTLLSFGVRKADDFDRAFAEIKKARPGGLVVHGEPLLGNHMGRIISFALESRVPAIYTQGQRVEAGGLMSYGANFPDLWRRAAVYVDKILKGRSPGELPVEQPTKFELVINLKTANQIGVTIPDLVLFRADKVIK